MPDDQRCPARGSTKLARVQNSAIDSELLECESCDRAYEVKFGPDGKAKLVAV